MSWQESHGHLVSEQEGSLLRITVSNPTAYNAMTLGMWQAMASAVSAVDPVAVRAVVIDGDGERAFVSGADISEFATLRRSAGDVTAYDNAVGAAQHAIARCTVPTIALVRGICMGGGLAMALACDLRYCNESARFRMPAARMGLGYSLDGIKRMCATLGMARTADLFLTARTFDGAEAARIGVVHEVFGDGAFAAAAQTRVDEVVANAPLTLRAARLALQHLESGGQSPSLKEVLAATRACFDSSDYEEGQNAFREKRPPLFTGR